MVLSDDKMPVIPEWNPFRTAGHPLSTGAGMSLGSLGRILIEVRQLVVDSSPVTDESNWCTPSRRIEYQRRRGMPRVSAGNCQFYCHQIVLRTADRSNCDVRSCTLELK